MPDLPITLLPPAGTLDGSELLAVVQEGETRKAPAADFFSPSPPPPVLVPGVDLTVGEDSAPMNLSIGFMQPIIGTERSFTLDESTLILVFGTVSVWRAQAPGFPDLNRPALVQCALSYDSGGAETLEFGLDFWLPWIPGAVDHSTNVDVALQQTTWWWLLLPPATYNMRLKVAAEEPDTRCIVSNDFGRSKILIMVPRLVPDTDHELTTEDGDGLTTEDGDDLVTEGGLP